MTDNELICAHCGGVIHPFRQAGGLRSAPPTHAIPADCFAVLHAKIAELEAAATWRPISNPPEAPGWYLGWNEYRVQTVRYLPEYEDDETICPWWDWYDDEVEITYWMSYPAPPQEAPAQ